MCESILCFWWFLTPTPLKLLTPTLPWFTFDRLQPCLTLTHSQPRSRLFNCLLLSLVHIHWRCSSSLSSSPLHRRSFSPRVGCGVASVCCNSVRKKGGTLSSVFVVTAVQINSEEDALRVCRLLPGFLSAPALPLSSEQ